MVRVSRLTVTCVSGQIPNKIRKLIVAAPRIPTSGLARAKGALCPDERGDSANT